jgi:hypothetical protein
MIHSILFQARFDGKRSGYFTQKCENVANAIDLLEKGTADSDK